jgi:hypothetical protein
VHCIDNSADRRAKLSTTSTAESSDGGGLRGGITLKGTCLRAACMMIVRWPDRGRVDLQLRPLCQVSVLNGKEPDSRLYMYFCDRTMSSGFYAVDGILENGMWMIKWPVEAPDVLQRTMFMVSYTNRCVATGLTTITCLALRAMTSHCLVIGSGTACIRGSVHAHNKRLR